MLDSQLLEILVCPETKQSLELAGAELLDKVNAAIASGQLTNRDGSAVTESITEALVREDQALLYAVRDDIPIMLVDEAIEIGHLG